MTFLTRHKTKFLIFVPVAVSLAVLAVAISAKAPPAQREVVEQATPVRVIAVPEVAVVPRAIGYGTVRAGRVWDAVAEVSARVAWTHPDLRNGAILPEGTTLVRLDESDTRLALRQAEAQLSEMDTRETNTRASLAIEQRNLALAEADLTRKRDLMARGAAAQSAVDAAERTALSIGKSVRDLQNTLALLPSERAVLSARRDQAALDLSRATVVAPMDLRVGKVTVEEAQYAAKGQVLFTADSLATAEVEAQLPIDRLMPLMGGGDGIAVAVAGTVDGSLMERLREAVALTPVVHLSQGAVQVDWPARLSRIAEQVDPETRTIGIVVTVDEPYGQAAPGHRPPLARNMFVQVELRAPPRPDSLVVPRSAVSKGSVYIADADDRLHRQPVRIAYTQGDLAVIAEGLAPGTRVVVSDVVPAVEGMKLDIVEDEAVLANLIAQAGGAGAIR